MSLYLVDYSIIVQVSVEVHHALEFCEMYKHMLLMLHGVIEGKEYGNFMVVRDVCPSSTSTLGWQAVASWEYDRWCILL